MIGPAKLALFAWQAGWVFGLRSLDLAAAPLEAPAALVAHALEKHAAFAEGAIQAACAVLEGARPDVVAEAAFGPTLRQVAANLEGLRGAG